MVEMKKLLRTSLVLLAFCPFTRADTVWVTSAPGGSALPRQNVKVTAIRGGKLVFQSNAGEATRELAQVARIALDDEPAFSAAEEAFSTNKFDVATDAYAKTVAATTKDWLRIFAAQRLVQSAQKANRFDAAADGYIALVRADPQSAAPFKPALPDPKSTYIATAITDVNSALADAKLTAPARQALQAFLAELQRARGDDKAAAQTNEKILQSAATSNDAAASGAASAALARIKLDAAANALAAKEFPKVITEIENNRRVFVERNDQAQALMYLADAKSGVAAQQNTQPAWQDAALAYMRVVAHFKDGPPSQFVPRALLNTGLIEERLGDTEAARSLYQQLVQQYPSDPAANDAKAALQRLTPK